MNQYIQEFVTYLQEVKQASPNTVGAYHNDLKKLEQYLEKQGIYSIAKLNETMLNSYVLSMEKEGMTPNTVSRNIASIKAFILFLLKSGKITGDPSEKLKPPKIIKKTPTIMDANLIDQLLKKPDLKTPKGIRDKAMLELMYATGLKVTELTSLKLMDINMSGRFLTCGDKRERVVPFGKTAKTALQNYLNIRSDTFDKNKSEIVFLNSFGEQLSRQGFWKILKTYAKEVGFKDINPSTLRHSFAAHLIENGADISCVQEFLGHSDISTTQLYLPHSYKSSREVYMNTHPRA